MNSFIIFIILIFQGLGSHIKDESTSIINGDLANIEDYPYYVFVLNILSMDQMYYCGGSILKPNIILTAGHCVSDGVINVYPGVTVLDDIVPSNAYKVKNYTIHPLYDGSSLSNMSYHDLALLKLESSITLGPIAQTIQIANEHLKLNQEVAIVGFGKVKCDEFGPGSSDKCINPMSDHLRSATLRIIHLGHLRIQSGAEDQHVCFGDSGGPMVYNGEIVGVCSTMDLKNCTEMSYYTRLSATDHKSWIEEKIQLFLEEDEENKQEDD